MAKKQRILVVDDTVANIKILSELLRGEYNVSVATNGIDALELAGAENKPDLILLDIMMPGMDGYEVCKKLKESSNTANIPVLFVTAKGDIDDETKGLAMGAVDYIVKPISPPKVLARIKTHLTLKHSREELEKQNEILQENLKLREDVEMITRHDIRSPLMIAINYPEMLKEYDNITDEQKMMLDDVITASYRILEMVDNSLDLYKMEKGLYQLKSVEVDLLATFRQVRAEVMKLMNKKNISMEIKLRGEPVEALDSFIISGEKLLCFSLFGNLIKNAIEASPENETVLISINDQSTPCEIQIQNNGAVPVELRDKFFEKYSTFGKEKGNGLGTYSAILMAKTLGGDIQMETSDSTGTTITVLLPKGM